MEDIQIEDVQQSDINEAQGRGSQVSHHNTGNSSSRRVGSKTLSGGEEVGKKTHAEIVAAEIRANAVILRLCCAAQFMVVGVVIVYVHIYR